MNSHRKQVLCVNGGSSSIKFALFTIDDEQKRVLSGKIDGIGSNQGNFSVSGSDEADDITRPMKLPGYDAAINGLVSWVDERINRHPLAAIGHRIVHGGPDYYSAQRITPEIRDKLHKFSSFDPEHLPEEILLTEEFHRRFPSVPQVACFDTEFHHEMPAIARVLPIPRRYDAMGVRRYGFHGLSCEFLIHELARVAGAERARGRVILAHLGSGASITAVRGGRSIDTSMSFTPTSGLPMSTRSGDLDPGIGWYLSRTLGMTAKQFHTMVSQESGLLGMSGRSSDMRELLAHEQVDPHAAEAVSVFCYHARKWVCALAGALGGVDTVVFAGGTGENSPVIRARICDGLEFLGIRLEMSDNEGNAPRISSDSSPVSVRVLRTDEESIIAKKVCRVLGINEGKEK